MRMCERSRAQENCPAGIPRKPYAYPSCQYLRQSSCTQLWYRTLWLSSSHQLLLIKNILSDLVGDSLPRRHRGTRR